MQKVKVEQDDSGHWYIIPNDLVTEFSNDLENEDIVDSGQFDAKWGKYRTGGRINNIQLYAEI